MPFFAPAFGTVIRRVKRRVPVRAVFICDNVVPHEPSPIDLPLTRYALRAVDGFVVMSNSVRDDLLRIRPEARWKLVPHPIYQLFGERMAKDEARAARAWLERLGPRFVALHPGSGSRAKSWPPDRFATLAQELAGPRPWLLVVGPADSEACGPLLGRRGVVVAAGLAPRILGALLARAGLYVGNDSGVSHLAAAFGAPTLALFGPTDPAQWSPVGPAVSVLRSPTGSMEDLGLAAVRQRAAELLESRT